MNNDLGTHKVTTLPWMWYTLAGLLGFILMSYELFVTRMVAPTVGLSVYTWTAAIGWVLLGISIGSWIGGWLTEKYPTKTINHILIALVTTSFTLIVGFLGARHGLNLISSNMIPSVLTLTAIVSLPFAIVISIITPQIASLVITQTNHVGRNYSYISLFHALGSILGVFLTGFFFFEILPLSYSIAALSILLLLIACVIACFYKVEKKICALVIFCTLTCAIVWILFLLKQTCITKASGIFCTDTQYYTARVIDAPFRESQSRVLFLDADAHSIANEKSPPALYTLFTYLPQALQQKPKTIAVLGAGAYVAPQMIALAYPHISIDVIDIDPALEKIARDNFFPNFAKNIVPITSDARWYVANTKTQYDVIIADVYNSLIAVPFHLTTKEYLESVKNALSSDGIYIFAFISERQNDTNDLAQALYATTKSVFDSVHVFALDQSSTATQNIVIVASKTQLPDFKNLQTSLLKNAQLKDVAQFLIENPDAVFTCENNCVLTDNFSPTEKLIAPVRQQYFSSLVGYLRSVF